MVTDVIHTFSLSLNDVDGMDWAELVRWHCQHQRIADEKLHLAQLMSQMNVLSLLSGAGGGDTVGDIPADYDEDYLDG